MNRHRTQMIAVYIHDCFIAATTNEILLEFRKRLKGTFELKIVSTIEDTKLKTDILGISLVHECKKGAAIVPIEVTLVNRINFTQMISKNHVYYKNHIEQIKKL